MRRTDRQITDPKQIEAFIAGEQIIRIAFWDGEEIYIVPVNYGYVNTEGHAIFYFHGAAAGRKYALCQACPSVGYEIDGNYRLLASELPCKFSAVFQSIVGTGRVKIVTDVEEKKTGLNAIIAQASGKSDWSYSQQALDNVAVFRLDVEKMSCKGRLMV